MRHGITLMLLITALCLAGCDRAATPPSQGADEHAGHDHEEGEHAEDADRAQEMGEAVHEGEDHAGGDHAGAQPEGEAHDEHEEGVIRLGGAELEEFGVTMATAGPGEIRRTLGLSGDIAVNPDALAHVAARAGGIGVEVRHTIGDRVEAGETLAVLESPELAEAKADYLARSAEAALAGTDLGRAETIHANTIRLLEIVATEPDVTTLRSEIGDLDIGANRSRLISAYADLRAAEAVYERESALYERQISSESDFLAAESAYKKALAGFQSVRDDLAFTNRRQLEAAQRAMAVAEVGVQAAERRLHALGLDEGAVARVEGESDMALARYEIRAPIDGLLIERHLVRGESVEAGRDVFVVADLSTVWGRLTVYQRDLGVVREGMPVVVTAAHDIGRAETTIDYVSPILDERTRTTTARVVLGNAEALWRPGMFVRADLGVGREEVRVAVPRTALLEVDGRTVVFVEADGGLEARSVELGRGNHERVEIVAGLSPGDRYVASGALALKAELDRAALEHAGHAH